MLFDAPAVPGVARLGVIDTGGDRACFLDLNVTAINETNGAIACLLEGTLVDDIDVDAGKGLLISVDADPGVALSMTLDASAPGVWADLYLPSYPEGAEVETLRTAQKVLTLDWRPIGSTNVA